MPSLPSLDSNCPSVVELKALLTGDLDQRMANRWQLHVAGCASCRQTLESIRESAPHPTQSLTSSAGHGVASTIEISAARAEESVEVSGVVLADRYELGGEIARGGMGIVHRATDMLFQREVAVKLLLPRWQKERDPQIKLQKQAQALEAFRYEAEITARLQHPGIPPVHDLGTLSDGLPFLAMKLIQGETLQQLLAARSSLSTDLSRWLQIFEQIAQAVGYAHSHGILHRDLKPANVMVGRFGEVQVMDWGLAKVIGAPEQIRLANEDDAPDEVALQHSSRREFVSLPGDIKGTLAYMPPEQANGAIDQLNARTDVFGLGAILCEILTGQPPYLGATRTELQQQAAAGALAGAVERMRASGVDAEIIELAICCLSADPADRLADGTAVAQAIAAHRVNVEQRLRRAETERALSEQRLVEQSRRRKLWYGIAAALLLLTVVSSSFALVYARSNAIIADRESKAKAAAALATQREGQAIAASARALTQEKIATDKAALSAAVNEFLQRDLLALAGAEEQLKVGLEVNPDLKARDLVLRAAERIEGKFADQPIVEAEIRDVLAMTLFRLGEFEAAVKQCLRVRELYTTLHGPDHRETLEAIHNLASAYMQSGKYDQGLPLHEEIVGLYEKQHGPHDRRTLEARNSLANAYRNAGQLEKALPIYEQILQLRTKELGGEHRDTLASKHNLALAYRGAGQLDRALPMLEETARLLARVHGPDHPETLGVIGNLAIAYRAAGQEKRALPLYEQVLDGRRKSLGAEHPDTLSAMNNLGVAYHAAGQLDRALPLFEQALQQRKLQLGSEHPQTLESMNNLVMVYLDTRQFELALPLAEETLKLRQAKLGPDHPQTIGSMTNLGNLYSDLGQHSRAIPLLEAALAARKAKFGDNHPETLSSLQNLSKAYCLDKQFERAIPLLEAALKMNQAHEGPEHFNTLVSMNNLATAYHETGKLEMAASLHERVLKIAAARLGPRHPNTIGSMLNLAMVEIPLQRFAAAEGHLQQVWDAAARLPPQLKQDIHVAAAQEFIKLYEAWDNFEKLAKWREELGKLQP